MPLLPKKSINRGKAVSMLQSMRHLAQSWVFKGLMLFLVVSFAAWGIGDIFRGNPLQRTVAEAGKTAITVQALNHEFEQMLARARQALGPELTAQQAKQLGVLDQALNNLIERAGLNQEIKKLGISVGDKPVLDLLAAQPQFRNKDGSFNRAQFRELLVRANMSERGFLDSSRQDMAQQQLIDALQSGGDIPQTIIDSVYRARGQKRILDVITVKNDSFGNVPVPDDKALQDFYRQNAEKFTLPEYRAITIARLSTDDIAKDIAISDADVKKQYEAKVSELSHPERRDIVQVVLQDETKAKQLAAAAKAGGNLSAVAKASGHDAVPLNGIDEKTALPELAKAIFALPVNGVSNPIKTELGWHVAQVKKIVPAGAPKFEEIKDQLREDMKRDQAIETATRLVNQLDDQLAAGHPLEDIADGMKLRLIKIPALDASGKTPDGKEPAELPDREDALKADFAQNSGETSPVLDDKNGSYFVVRTDEVTPSAVPAFEKNKDRALAEWKTAEQAKRAVTEAGQIAEGLRAGKAPASFAAETGVDVRVSKPVSLLGDVDPALPQTTLPEIFKLKKGDVTVMPMPDRQLVVRLSELVDTDPAKAGDALDKVKEELQNRMPGERAAEYLKYLRVLFPVEINEGVFDSLRQQGG